MRKKILSCIYSGYTWIFISLVPLLCSAFSLPQQPVSPIVLQNELHPLKAEAYAIEGVTDERLDAGAVAWLVPDVAVKPALPEKVNLQGGTLNSVRNFINHNLVDGNPQRKIVIGIKQLKITETLMPDQRVQGKVVVELSCSIRHGDDTVHLVDYRGGMHYTRPINNRQVIEPGLRHSLMSGLAYFNTWIDRQADTNPQLATAVHLTITDYTAPDEADTIYYQTTRPLRWQDFKDKPYGSRYAASVFPGFGFDMQQHVTAGIVQVKLAIKVYVPKSACWVRDFNRTPDVLSHEQLHFDVVKLISERYKRQLLHTDLPVESYEGVIHAAYYKFFHEMNVMQESYDGETHHGQYTAAQQEWNKRIKTELADYLALKS